MIELDIGFVHKRNPHGVNSHIDCGRFHIRKTRFCFVAFITVTLATVAAFSACALQNNSNAAEVPVTDAPAIPAATETTFHEPGDRLDKILASGEIVVATSPDFAPMEFIDNRKDGQDQYVGTDPWFARYIADKLGVKLRIEAMSFDALETALTSGSADLIMSGFAATESRAVAFELSDYYNIVTYDKYAVIVRKGAEDEYKLAGDFKGKVIAVEADSPQYTYLQEQLPGAKPELITHINDGVMLLITKKADALAIDGANGRAICENYPDLVMSGFRFDYETEGNVIGMPKGELSLLERINEIITVAASEDMFDKWLKEAETLADEIGWQN